MGRPTELGPVGQRVISNVRILRDRRGWSAADLAGRMVDMAHPVTRAQLANLENGRRATLSLEETVALAEVLHVVPWWTLATDTPMCGYCRSNPPPGFVCVVCKMVGPAPVAVQIVDDPIPADGGNGLFAPEGWETFQKAMEQRTTDFTSPALSRQHYRDHREGLSRVDPAPPGQP